MATPGDAGAVARHRAEMFRDMGEADDAVAALIENASIDHLAALIEAREYYGFLAAHEEEIVAGGGAWLRPLLPRPGTPRGGHEAYLLNVFVEREHRRAGLARELMAWILEWCASRGVARVTLHASAEGRPLYESLGFTGTNEMRLGRSIGTPPEDRPL